MFPRRCQAEFLRLHLAKTCALRMMRLPSLSLPAPPFLLLRLLETGVQRGIVKQAQEDKREISRSPASRMTGEQRKILIHANISAMLFERRDVNFCTVSGVLASFSVCTQT